MPVIYLAVCAMRFQSKAHISHLLTTSPSISVVRESLCKRPSSTLIFAGFLVKTSLGCPISHWVGLFSTFFFLIGEFDKNGQLSKIRGFCIVFPISPSPKWLLFSGLPEGRKEEYRKSVFFREVRQVFKTFVLTKAKASTYFKGKKRKLSLLSFSDQSSIYK